MGIFRVIFVCAVLSQKNFLHAEESAETTNTSLSTVVKNTFKNGVEWIGDEITNVVDKIVPIGEGVDLFEGRTMCKKRKKHHKKNKFLIPMLVGFLLIKSILLPLALKAVAVLSGKAFILSLMSLILAAIVGLRRIVAGGFAAPTGFSYDGYSKYRRKDQLGDDRNSYEDEDPYRYYREPNRRR